MYIAFIYIEYVGMVSRIRVRGSPLIICQTYRKKKQRRDHKRINKLKVQSSIFEILALIKRTFSILHRYIVISKSDCSGS